MQIEEKMCKKCNRHYKRAEDFLHNTSGWRKCSDGHLWFECACLSTLMLPRGKFSWYDPSKFMSPESGAVFNKLGGLQDLPHIPTRIMKLLGMCDDPDIAISKIAMEVKLEPIVADEVFRVANHLRSQRVRGSTSFEHLDHA